MPTFVPLWPKAQDGVPLFADGLSPVTAQWFNNAQTLAQVMEAEIGVGIVDYPTNTLKKVLDILHYDRQAGQSALGKMRGLSRTVSSGATHTTLGLGTLQVSFSLLNPEDVPGTGNEAYVHLGTVLEASDVRGGIINGHPITTLPGVANDPAITVTTLYFILGAFSDGGVMAGAGTPTTHHVIFGLAEFQ